MALPARACSAGGCGLTPALGGRFVPGYGRIWAEMSAVRKEVTTRLDAIAGELTNELTIVSVA